MAYSGATSGSCSFSTPMTGLSYESSDIEYEYPDISAFAASVPLDIDDATRSSFYTPITECIWGSSGYKFFASISGRVTGPNIGCPLGAVEIATKEADIDVPDCWYYSSHGNGTVPPAFSLGRVRTTIIPANPACGVFTSGCFGSLPAPSCSVRAFGMWANLRVIGNKLNVTLWWWPRGISTGVRYDRLGVYAPFRVQSGSSNWTNTLPQNASPSCFSSMYPYATSTLNISGPGSIVYEKTIDCDEDFTGSPITLPRISISKANPSSTQNTFEAVGITGIPSSITITPV
jgi:hypothetical protein